jgi:hypothetical protein
LIGYILRRNCPLTHVIEGKIAGRNWQENEEEGVSSYWVNACKREDTGNWKRKHWIWFCGELALEEAMDVSLRHCRINEFILPWYCCTRCSWILCRYFINLKIFLCTTWILLQRRIARRPTPKPEYYPRSAVVDCLFNLLPATLHMWRPLSPLATWRRARSWSLPWADIAARTLFKFVSVHI